jgi:streptogramin lyase
MRSKRRIGLGVGVAVVLAWVVWTVLRPEPPGIERLDADEASDAGAPGAVGEARPASARPATASASDGGLPEARTGPGQVFAELGWGSGEGQLGKDRPDEANPEGPMSLTVDAQGTVWVLDQVNQRLVKLDRSGQPAGSVPLPLQAAQDVVTTKDGKTLVLDRLVDKAVAVLGPDGKQLGELSLEGKGLPEGGAATGLFTDGDDVYVEREHGDSVLVGNTKGQPNAERPEVPGRPAGDGKTFLTAGIVDSATGQVMVTAIERESRAHRFTRQLSVGSAVVALNALDADRSGVIYLGTVLELPGSTPEAPAFGIALLCLDPLDGRPLGQVRFGANSMPEETFRELTVLPEGGVLFLERTPSGARLVRYGCGP